MPGVRRLARLVLLAGLAPAALAAQAQPGPADHVRQARERARTGDVEGALAALDAAAKAGFGDAGVGREADFDRLRLDARFRDALAAIDRNARPCAYAPESDQFDFWLGEWDVHAAKTGAPAGTSRVEKILGNCVVLENWTSARGGYAGKSFNVYDAARKRWQQTWVDTGGLLLELRGQATGEGMELSGPSRAPDVDNTLTFTNQGPDRVRQLWRQSSDGGKTWSVVFDGIYERKGLPPALLAMADAERAFAKMGLEQGIPASFYEYFAEDGVNFTPSPSRTREALRKRPAGLAKPPVTLRWEPAYGDVAASGELGYLTGPYVLSDDAGKNPPRYGFYSSIWRKEPGGVWRVAVDGGISLSTSTEPLFGQPFARAPRPVGAAPTAAPQEKASKKPNKNKTQEPPVPPPATESPSALDLTLAEERLLTDLAESGVAKAYASRLDPGVRLHREDVAPILGREGALAQLRSAPAVRSGEVLASGLAASGELGYAYGTLELAGAPKTTSAGAPAASAPPAPRKAHFLRVWRKDGSGEWRIVFDVELPVPQE